MNKILFAFLAIFLVVMSACAVSAEESNDIISVDGDLTPGEDPTFLNEPNDDDASDSDDVADEEVDDNITGGDEDLAVDSPLSDDEDNTTSGNESDDSSSNDLPATGNPVLVLMASLALVGAYTIRRK